MLNIPAGYKLVPIEPTETMVVCGFESRPDPVFSKPEDWEAFTSLTGCQQAAHKARLCYAAMLDAAPSPASVAPGDAQDEDDSIALDKLADYIADTWPDKKYGLEEICQRLHAMWPGEFLSAADLEKNDPNVREALRALLLWWNRFQASDGDPKDACELLVKGARSAWQFAEVEIDRVPVPAPAAGDAPDTVSLVTRQGPGQQLFTYTSQPCDNVIAWRIGEACTKASQASAGDYIDRGLGLLKELQAKGYGVAALAAQVPQQGEA